MSTTRRDRPGSMHLTPLNPGIDPTPTPVFDPIAQRDAARANADRATRCHYLKPSGERCGSPAMVGHELCTTIAIVPNPNTATCRASKTHTRCNARSRR
jgi:hypothetical protein